MSFYCDTRDDEFLSGSVAHCYCSYYSYPNVNHFPYVYPVFEPDYNLGLGPKDKPVAKCRYGKYPCTCCDKCHRGERELRFAESEVKKKKCKDACTETDPAQNKGVSTAVSSNECEADNEAMLEALRNLKSCECKADKRKPSENVDPPKEEKKASLISIGSTRSRSPSILKTTSRLSVSSQNSSKLKAKKCPGGAKKIRKCPGPRKLAPPEEIMPLKEKSPTPIKKSPTPIEKSPPHHHHKHHDHSSKLLKRLKAIDTLKNLSSLIATHPVVMF